MWPDREGIADGVMQMLQVNMGLKPGERLLVVTDLPRLGDWEAQPAAALEDMLERAMLARLVADVAGEGLGCPTSFYPFPATGGHGTEPGPEATARLREADVAIALTTYSLSHTNAREAATRAGVRLASMPSFEAAMLAPGGPMAADYRQVAADCRRMADVITAVREARVRTPLGTDLRFSLEGRTGLADDGLYTTRGAWGNLPAGEAYVAPLEGSGEGRLVVPAGWYPGLAEALVLRFARGLVVEVEGGGEVGERFRRQLDLASDDPACRTRRNLAELGVGANPNARRPENVLESEKIKGTVHIAIGDNAHMGGVVEADLHEDFVQPQPDLLLDGRLVIRRGEWQV